jgi:hypothetical protein
MMKRFKDNNFVNSIEELWFESSRELGLNERRESFVG